MNNYLTTVLTKSQYLQPVLDCNVYCVGYSTMEKHYIQQTLNTAFINKTTMPVMLYDFNWTSSRLAIVIIKDFSSESNQKS